MKDLVKKFLSESDRTKITESVKKVETITSGEIVPMVVSSSGIYILSAVIGGVALSVPPAILGAYFLGEMASLAMRDLWVFLGLEAVLFIAGYLLVNNVAWLKRLFTPDDVMQEQVRAAAFAGFYGNGLHRTKRETGVLIYISVFERMVWVLGDRGINEKVGQDAWNGLVAMITDGIRSHEQAEAICAAVGRAGEMLRENFPVTADDRDELPNLITGK